MTRLKSKLLSFNAQKSVPVKIFSPANCEEVRIPFKTDKVVKVVGKLASIPPPMPLKDGEEAPEEQNPNLISGVLIQNDFKISLMAPEDLKEWAGLTTTTILCRQHLTLSAAGVELIRWALEGTFGAITETTLTDEAINGKEEVNGNGTHDDDEEEADDEIERSSKSFKVMDCVNVNCRPGGRVEVEWEGNMMNDGIADAVLAVLFTVESSPAAVKRKFSLTTNLHLLHLLQHMLTHLLPESSRSHSHSPVPDQDKDFAQLSHRFKSPNPHKTPDPATRLSRLLMFLEAQFGEDAVSPIPYPRNSTSTADPATATSPDGPFSVAGLPLDDMSAKDKAELKRLHSLGIPVPGIEIKFDKYVAKVWLEDLDVECASVPLKARVKAIVERGIETVSGLWT
jgi:cleavage and polyadenylation specificity factor subunit 3